MKKKEAIKTQDESLSAAKSDEYKAAENPDGDDNDQLDDAPQDVPFLTQKLRMMSLPKPPEKPEMRTTR